MSDETNRAAKSRGEVIAEVHAAGPLDLPFWIGSVSIGWKILAVNSDESTRAEAQEWCRGELKRRGLVADVLDWTNHARTWAEVSR